MAENTTGASGRNVLEIARAELGQTEQPAGSNRTKYGAWFGLDGYPWCMMFVQWCFDQAGQPLPYKTASCSALLNWYRKNQPERIVTEPQPCDIIIYNFGHTGIVAGAADHTVTAVEGNTSPSNAGSQDNGGGVYRRTRNKTTVTAYIRPFDGGEQEDDMDQEKFNQMFRTAMEAYRNELRDNDSGAWSKEARDFAVASGLFAGSGTAPDGQPNYMWEDLLTREQVAQLFYRFAQRNGLT